MGQIKKLKNIDPVVSLTLDHLIGVADTSIGNLKKATLQELLDLLQANFLIDRITLDEDGTYTLEDGWQLDQINIKCSEESNITVGLTLDGDEVMEDTLLDANVTKPVQILIVAEDGDVLIYFAGITATTDITIYKRIL